MNTILTCRYCSTEYGLVHAHCKGYIITKGGHANAQRKVLEKPIRQIFTREESIALRKRVFTRLLTLEDAHIILEELHCVKLPWRNSTYETIC